MREYDFSKLPGGPAAGRGVYIKYSDRTRFNVMVYDKDGGKHRVFGPTADLVEAKVARDEIRQIINAACLVANQPIVHR